MAVTKEYNIRRHYEAKNYEKYKDLDVKQKLQKVQETKRSLNFLANYVHENKIKR